MNGPTELAWRHGLWDSKPLWPSDPPIPRLEQIVCEHLRLADDELCTVAFFAEGAFNKRSTSCTTSPRPVARRASCAPRYPSTRGARRSLRSRRSSAVRQTARARPACDGARCGRAPVRVDVPRAVLNARWTAMSLDAKEALVRDVVACFAELSGHTLRRIGNIYPGEGDTVERIVSMAFFWDQRGKQDVPRGPFRRSADWLAARLALVMNEAAQTLATSADEDDLEEAEKTIALGRRLVVLLPRVFPPDDVHEPEVTVIHHDDLSFYNLLVDDAGKLTGIVDWECVSALPPWYACQLPSFLHGRPRAEQPDVADYHIEEHGRALYDEHLREWEQTRLCRVFRAEMARVCPAWMEEHRAGRVRADFEIAVACCDSELARRTVCRRVDGFEAGVEPYVSLQAQLFLTARTAGRAERPEGPVKVQ